MTVSLDEVVRLVELSLGKRGIRAEDRFLEDLNAESADVLNIVAAAEDKYKIYIAEQDLPDLRCALDLHHFISQRNK